MHLIYNYFVYFFVITLLFFHIYIFYLFFIRIFFTSIKKSVCLMNYDHNNTYSKNSHLKSHQFDDTRSFGRHKSWWTMFPLLSKPKKFIVSCVDYRETRFLLMHHAECESSAHSLDRNAMDVESMSLVAHFPNSLIVLVRARSK